MEKQSFSLVEKVLGRECHVVLLGMKGFMG